MSALVYILATSATVDTGRRSEGSNCCTNKKLHIKGQTLRLYNPASHQWSIYLVDVDNGTLGLPPMVGQFTTNRGEFYDQEEYKGRAILVRYLWVNISPQSARMEQSF